MKTLITPLLLILLALPSYASELPPCPEDQTQTYHNCFGTITFANGNKYVGEFKDGKENGQGAYTFPSGEKYVGEFKDDKKHGKGTYLFLDGDKYVGGFKDDKKTGKGTYTFASGKVKSGIWADGKYLYDLAESVNK